MLFSNLRNKLDAALKGQCLANELLAKAVSAMMSIPEEQAELVNRMNMTIDRYEKMSKMFEETMSVAKAREAVMENYLFAKTKESETVRKAVEAKALREAAAEPSEYDKRY